MKRVLAFLILLPLMVGCSRLPPEYKETRYVFGTLVQFIIRGVDETTAKRAVASVARDFRRMQVDWNAWQPSNGELVELNRAIAQGKGRAMSPFVLPLIKRAQELEIKSGGLFNPAIGNLIGAWGFHQDTPPTGPLPDLKIIRVLAAQHADMSDLVISGNFVKSRNRAVSLDFGGFAKGVALDMAIAKFKSLGIKNAIVNAGGDLDTIGSAGKRMWKVGIRDPRGSGVIASVNLHGGENIYTSGDYERYRIKKGVRYPHIIDPRTGMPADSIISASVLSKGDGALADAAATALSVAGPKDWVSVARRMGVKYVMLVGEDGTIYISPEMLARITFETKDKPRIVQSASLSRLQHRSSASTH